MSNDPLPISISNRALPWAIYLGISWTWCIGMFLPVLLIRDIGLAGFWVFAVPNVVGAAAMGWILRDAGQSRAMTRRHESVCVWFSLITLLFQAFFAAWIIRQIIGRPAGILLAGGFCLMWLIFRAVRGGTLLAAGLTFVISVAVMAWGFAHPGLLPNVATTRAPAGMDALFLAPVCLLGFGLCPYLDLTFHHARQNLSASSARLAFSIGFGLVFAMMLGFTVCYSGWLTEGFVRHPPRGLVLILGAHLVMQICFTVAAHAEQLAPPARKLPVGKFLAFALAFVAVVLAGSLDRRGNLIYRGLSLGELIYRCFMVFYGLVFPAYVWLFIVPGRAIRRWWWIVILLAAPMYWMGFIERQMIWLVPGVFVVVMGRFVFARATHPPDQNA